VLFVPFALLSASSTARSQTQPTTAPAPKDAGDRQWAISPKDYANTRYVALDAINTDNAKTLQVKWTMSTGIDRGHEAAPLVVGVMMYVVTPHPNYLYGIDLKNPSAWKWRYEPKPTNAARGVACCDYVNRGCMYWEGKIVMNTLDGHTCAVDAKTGEELWKTRLADINPGETITMARRWS